MNATTQSANFAEIPAADTHLMHVAPGVDSLFALSIADCLDDSVRRLLLDASASTEGMDPAAAYLCEFAMDASRALRAAAGATA